MTALPEGLELSVRIGWPIDAAKNAVFANSFAVVPAPPKSNGEPDGFIHLIAGQTSQPVLTDEASVREFRAGGSVLEVRPIVSIAMSVDRAVELRDLLTTVITHLDGPADGR